MIEMRQSKLSAHAGCVADPEETSAGCAGLTGEESQADAPLQADGESTGSAAPVAADASETRATPPQTMREFERALRGLGFSRLQAEHIARKGFHTAPAEPSPEPVTSEQLRQAIERLARAMKA